MSILQDLLEALPNSCIQRNSIEELRRFVDKEKYPIQYCLDDENCLIGLITRDIEWGEIVFDKEESHLQHLNLCENTLKEITFKGGFPELKKIYLSNSGIEKLDISQAQFPALEEMFVKKNQLKSLIFERDCPQLYLLDARENPELITFDLKGNHEMLEYLFLQKTAIENIDKAVWDKQNSAVDVKNWLKESRKEGNEIINTTVKMIIVGNGRVGKTSMYTTLMGEKPSIDAKYTHGIQIGTLDKNHLTVTEWEDIRVNVFDFGGQEIFYAAHQLFLTDDALYILAWTHPKNEENNKVAYHAKHPDELPMDGKRRTPEHWYHNIRMYAPKSPVLSVQTHFGIRENRIKDWEKPILEKIENSLDFDSLSCHNLDTLKKEIEEIFKTNAVLPLGNPALKNYFEVLKALKEKDLPFISVSPDFEDLCREKGIDEGGAVSVCNYFNTLGEICYFDKPGLNHKIYTKPEWLTEQVYKVINKALENTNGKITQDYIKGVFPEASEREEILALLQEFKLIFYEKAEDCYIVPQYLPEKLDENAAVLFEIIKESLGGPVFTFHYPEFMPENIIINFLCEYGAFARQYYWRAGICFIKDKQPCVVICNEDTQQISFFTKDATNAICKEVSDAFLGLGKNVGVSVTVQGVETPVPLKRIKAAFEIEKKDSKPNLSYIDTETQQKIWYSQVSFLWERGERWFDKEENLELMIQKNELMKALEYLKERISEKQKNDAIFQMGRLHSIESSRRKGTLSFDDYKKEENQIRDAILTLKDSAGFSGG